MARRKGTACAVRWSNVLLMEDLGWRVVADDYYGAWMWRDG